MGKIVFGSFPRSGNHFFKSIAGCEWLEHRIQPLSERQNVVVTIRNPLECVPSWIAMMQDTRQDRAEQVLEWYCSYYDKCKEVGVLIIPFAQLISEPLFCLNHVYKTFGLPLIDSLDFDLNTGFHFPSIDKSGYSKIIEEMKLAPSFKTAMGLFEELCVPVV
jgi:hypothetical protein